MPNVKETFYKKPKTLDSIANRTLGFQEIFALSLPDRKDRRVPLEKAANATNITLTVLDAVRDEQIPKDKYPKGWVTDGDDHKVGEIGCLRSHVMTWEKIIEENISTALIMESDADWDVRIHDILPGVAKGAKQIADWPFPDADHPKDIAVDVSPYGDNWDILWIGHCGSHPDGTGRIYQFKDETVPPEDKEYTFAGKPRKEVHPEGTRIVFEFQLTICTSAYAISQKGAVKLSKVLEHSNLNIDVRMQQACNDEPSLTCLGVWPQVITAAPSESNIKHPAAEQAPGTAVDGLDNGLTAGPAIQYSSRRNADNLLKGLGREKWVKEW